MGPTWDRNGNTWDGCGFLGRFVVVSFAPNMQVCFCTDLVRGNADGFGSNSVHQRWFSVPFSCRDARCHVVISIVARSVWGD